MSRERRLMLMDSHSSRNNGVRPGSINSQGGGGAAGRGLPTGEGVVTSPFPEERSIEKGGKGSGVEEWRRRLDWR